MSKEPKPITNNTIIQTLAKTEPAWCQRISSGSRDFLDEKNIVKLGNTLLSDYSLRNEFVSDLLNRIGLVTFEKTTLTNPLAVFKEGSMAYGDIEQEIGVDVVDEHQFEGLQPTKKQPDQFEQFGSNTEADYHQINRRSMYGLSIPDPRYRTAFTSPTGLSTLIGEMVEKLQDSDIVDEFIYAKRTLRMALTQTQRPLLTGQKAYVPDITGNTTPQDFEKFNYIVRDRTSAMSFNNRDFNAHGFMSTVRKENFVIIINRKYTIKNDITYLSNIFNSDLARIQIPIINIDDFGENDKELNYNPETDEKIIGVICDRGFLKIRNVLLENTSNFNARSLVTNRFLHVHQLHKTNFFKPVVYLLADKGRQTTEEGYLVK